MPRASGSSWQLGHSKCWIDAVALVDALHRFFSGVHMHKAKQLAIVAKQKSARVAAGMSAMVLSGAAMAQATGDPGLDAINGLGAKVTSYTGAALTVAVLAAGAWWGIAMMKKAFGKAK